MWRIICGLAMVTVLMVVDCGAGADDVTNAKGPGGLTVRCADGTVVRQTSVVTVLRETLNGRGGCDQCFGRVDGGAGSQCDAGGLPWVGRCARCLAAAVQTSAVPAGRGGTDANASAAGGGNRSGAGERGAAALLRRDLCPSIQARPGGTAGVPASEPQDWKREAADVRLWQLPAKRNMTLEGTYVWHMLLSLPISLRLRMMAAVDAANKGEAHVVLGHEDGLLNSLHNFDGMRRAWRQDIRGTAWMSSPYRSMLSVYRENNASMPMRPTLSDLDASFRSFCHPVHADFDAAKDESAGSNSTPPSDTASTVPPSSSTTAGKTDCHWRMMWLVESRVHIDDEYCRYADMISSSHASLYNVPFQHDHSCNKTNITADTPIPTEVDEMFALKGIRLLRANAQNYTVDSKRARRLLRQIRAGHEVGDADDADAKGGGDKDADADADDGGDWHSTYAPSFLPSAHSLSGRTFSFLEEDSVTRPAGSSRPMHGTGSEPSVSGGKTVQDSLDDMMTKFDNIDKKYGIEGGDLAGVYTKIVGAGITRPQHIKVDPNGKSLSVDMHFLDPIKKLMAEKDLLADAKGYMRRKKAREKRHRQLLRKERHKGRASGDWNADSESEVSDDDDTAADSDGADLNTSAANHTRDIGSKAHTELMVMTSLCHQGIGRDIAESLRAKVRSESLTMFMSLISGFIGPLVQPIMKSGFGIFIEIIGKAMCDAMADSIMFPLVGIVAPLVNGMLVHMMVPTVAMGIITVLPQALVKTLESKFVMMLGAPLSKAVVKAVLKYRSTVSTPQMYHSVSHSLSHSIHAVLSTSLVHTVTNTAGSALAHSLSHSLPAYYACMRCYHDRTMGLARPAGLGAERDECALCYNSNAYSTQQRQAYAQPSTEGYRTMPGNAANPLGGGAPGEKGVIERLVDKAGQLLSTGSTQDPQTFGQAAGQVTSQDAS